MSCLTAALVMLKLAEVTPALAALSWWVVLAPSLIMFAFATFALSIVLISAALITKH